MTSFQPAPGISYSHAGLTQSNRVDYHTHDGRRTLASTNGVGVPGQKVVREVHLTLPLFLTPQVWLRYGYSLSDVLLTLDFFRAENLYQLALLFGISPSNSAVKVAFASKTSIVFSSKAIAVKKIKTVLVNRYQFAVHSVLDTVRTQHVPPLPVVEILKTDYDRVITWIPDDVKITKGDVWPCAYRYKDISLVPYAVEKGAIYAVRVVPWSTFLASGRRHGSLSTRPMPVTLRDDPHTKYCAVEEACFLVPRGGEVCT